MANVPENSLDWSPGPKQDEIIPSMLMSQAQSTEIYSIFSKAQKRCIIYLVAFAASFSTLSSFIYFPAINTLANSLSTSVGKINLTITSYMVVSAIIPSLVGDAADVSGRRPMFLFTLAMYFSANIGLAVQRSFSTLLILRMVQSAGISGKDIAKLRVTKWETVAE